MPYSQSTQVWMTQFLRKHSPDGATPN